jgi:hypothetical protein
MVIGLSPPLSKVISTLVYIRASCHVSSGPCTTKFFQDCMIVVFYCQSLQKKTPQKHSATFDTLTLSASSNDHDAKFSFSHPLDIIVNFSILLTLWPLGTHMKWYLTWEQLWEMYDGNLTIISFDGSKSWIINDGFHFPLI